MKFFKICFVYLALIVLISCDNSSTKSTCFYIDKTDCPNADIFHSTLTLCTSRVTEHMDLGPTTVMNQDGTLGTATPINGKASFKLLTVTKIVPANQSVSNKTLRITKHVRDVKNGYLQSQSLTDLGEMSYADIFAAKWGRQPTAEELYYMDEYDANKWYTELTGNQGGMEYYGDFDENYISTYYELQHHRNINSDLCFTYYSDDEFVLEGSITFPDGTVCKLEKVTNPTVPHYKLKIDKNCSACN